MCDDIMLRLTLLLKECTLADKVADAERFHHEHEFFVDDDVNMALRKYKKENDAAGVMGACLRD